MGLFQLVARAAARYLVKSYCHHNQVTYCYCPGCGFELCGSGSWVGPDETGAIERYVCQKCGQMCGWMFDIPGPILVEGVGCVGRSNPLDEDDGVLR